LRGAGSDLDDVATVGIHRVKVPASGAGGAEGDGLAVGAEAGLGVFRGIAGELSDAGAVHALEVNLGAGVVAGTGVDEPFSGGIDVDVGVVAFIRGGVLLEAEVASVGAGSGLLAIDLAEDVDDRNLDGLDGGSRGINIGDGGGGIGGGHGGLGGGIVGEVIVALGYGGCGRLDVSRIGRLGGTGGTDLFGGQDRPCGGDPRAAAEH
jgi:hypothetical protein